MRFYISLVAVKVLPDAYDLSMRTLLKYAGNKRAVMEQIRPHLGFDASTRRYIEPFGGALGAAANASPPAGVETIVSDANPELINLYREVVADASAVVAVANSWGADEASYYAIRDWDRAPGWREARSPRAVAARTLYLNKRGFNGLFRINKKGHFTTPWNRDPKGREISIDGLDDFIGWLRGITILERDWREAVSDAGPGDVLYCDPPYVDLKDPRAQFGGYVGAFGWSEQVALRDALVEAAARGARVVASNSWCDATVELYRGFDIVAVVAPRSIGSRADSRGGVKELLAWLAPAAT